MDNAATAQFSACYDSRVTTTENEQLQTYVRAADYLAAAQIYLRDNFLLERPLMFADIKPRLLGHWGTAPGVNFIYAHCNRIIRNSDRDMIFVLGPGHGFAALQANLFLEGTLSEVYPEARQSKEGIAHIIRNFCWPYGFPSHSSPGAPGVIVEGGELGYALASAYGAALDNPNLIVTCVVGDGEAETGATATAWHANKFVNPRTSGAVLPILHLNGYKISGPTVFARMSNKDLVSLFRGYGHEPLLVEIDEDMLQSDAHELMAATMDKAHEMIRAIQTDFRENGAKTFPRFPMILFRSPKGWTGIKDLEGKTYEGNYLSHQVVGAGAKTDDVQLRAVESWLRSYRFTELFSEHLGFSGDIAAVLPPPSRTMGRSPYVRSAATNFALPEYTQFSEDAQVPGTIGSSSMRRAGAYMKAVMQGNGNTFRFFSPDETYSNKLDQIFEATTRAFLLPRKKTDADMADDGHVIEMLSEQTLQGLLQGYVLTGRHAVFASYEAFIHIVASMVDQYAKFMHVRNETAWQHPVPSLNYILTSSGWRQEHNGFSHQNPGFIDDMLKRQGCFVRVYFPPDGNATLACLARSLASRNGINIICAGKTQEPRWLTPELAEKELQTGIMTWDFASDADPQVVVVGIGDYVTKEALAAIDLVKHDVPTARLRMVNVMEMGALGFGDPNCRVPIRLDDYITKDKPVVVNFHGYPETVKHALFDAVDDPRRFTVHGYIEHGSTTTPFDMQVRNLTDRYHLAMDIVQGLVRERVIDQAKGIELVAHYNAVLADHRAYITANGIDPDFIENWKWKRA